MSNRYRIYSDELITIMALKAKQYYLEGWGLSMAMSKAGFTAGWRRLDFVMCNSIVKELVEYNKKISVIKNKHKKMKDHLKRKIYLKYMEYTEFTTDDAKRVFQSIFRDEYDSNIQM